MTTEAAYHHHHYHQSLNRGGRWGTTDQFATSFLHFSLFSTALWDLPNSKPVHSLMLSSHLFFCLNFTKYINIYIYIFSDIKKSNSSGNHVKEKKKKKKERRLSTGSDFFSSLPDPIQPKCQPVNQPITQFNQLRRQCPRNSCSTFCLS